MLVVVVSCVTSWPCAAFTTNKHLPRSFLLQINMESMVSSVTKMCLQQACDKKRLTAEAQKHFLQVGYLRLLQEIIKNVTLRDKTVTCCPFVVVFRPTSLTDCLKCDKTFHLHIFNTCVQSHYYTALLKVKRQLCVSGTSCSQV